MTYKVQTLGGGDLPDGSNTTSTGKTPELNVRMANVQYSAGSIGRGIAAYDASSPPNLHLLLVLEPPSGNPC